MDPAIPAIISVCVTGLVSFVSVVVGALVPLIVDSRRSRREKAAAERQKMAAETERIDEAALELLYTLNRFAEGSYPDIGRARSELRAKHYAWERAIWSRLNPTEQDQLREMRRKFEQAAQPDHLKVELQLVTHDILLVTYNATERE